MIWVLIAVLVSDHFHVSGIKVGIYPDKISCQKEAEYFSSISERRLSYFCKKMEGKEHDR